MTATPDAVASKKAQPTAEQKAAEELLRQAREHGLSLTPPWLAELADLSVPVHL